MKTTLIKNTMLVLAVLIGHSIFAQQTITSDLIIKNDGSPYTTLTIKRGDGSSAPLGYCNLVLYNYIIKAGNGATGGPFGLSFFKEGETNPKLFINDNGNVVIGATKYATNANFRLSVDGAIRSKEIVCETGWSDFVFEEDYKLMPLSQLEQYIKANKHLPEIPSAAEVTENGVPLAEMESRLLQKIEEITLYVIQQNKDLEKQQAEIEKLKLENEELREQINKLSNE